MGKNLSSFPIWVPAEAVKAYEDISSREKDRALVSDPFMSWDEFSRSCEYENGLQILGYVIESPELEKAWKSISRRQKIASPAMLCRSIFQLESFLRNFDIHASKETVAAHKDFARSLTDAVYKFEKSTNEEISSELHREIHYVRMTADYMEFEFNEWLTYVGKPSAGSAKRVALVRRLSEITTELYGQPLYEVVASLAAVILGEKQLETDHVRKIIKDHEKRPPSHFDSMKPPEDFWS